jgi:flavin reductase (DIM6/NTAB) family NADH-FMN oxidoreductase RutF
MINEFQRIQPGEIPDNTFKLIGEDWMLITAGDANSWNTMTASWGTLGVLWNKPVAICFIRPQRFTYQFSERNLFFTLSFFTEQYRDALNFCGTKSGRDYDKAAETGLTIMQTERGSVAFSEARLILECRKIYTDLIQPGQFIMPDLVQKNYPRKDFHRFYIGEVVNTYIKAME